MQIEPGSQEGWCAISGDAAPTAAASHRPSDRAFQCPSWSWSCCYSSHFSGARSISLNWRLQHPAWRGKESRQTDSLREIADPAGGPSEKRCPQQIRRRPFKLLYQSRGAACEAHSRQLETVLSPLLRRQLPNLRPVYDGRRGHNNVYSDSLDRDQIVCFPGSRAGKRPVSSLMRYLYASDRAGEHCYTRHSGDLTTCSTCAVCPSEDKPMKCCVLLPQPSAPGLLGPSCSN